MKNTPKLVIVYDGKRYGVEAPYNKIVLPTEPDLTVVWADWFMSEGEAPQLCGPLKVLPHTPGHSPALVAKENGALVAVPLD